MPPKTANDIHDQLAADFKSPRIDRVLAVYRPLLRRAICKRCPQNIKRRVDVSDLVQECLLRSYRGRETFRGSTNAELRSWFRKITRNVLRDTSRFHRRAKRDVTQDVQMEESEIAARSCPATVAYRSEQLQRIEHALNQLSEAERIALRMRSSGASFTKIGQKLNRSTDAARMFWGRALKRLTKVVGQLEHS